jgi:hypothetical protein
MIKQRLIVQEDGSHLIETYSTEGYKIRQEENGAIYDTAIDPEQWVRTYTETDELIEQSEEDAQQILDILFGGTE